MNKFPDFSKMKQQEFFNWLEGQLGEGWACGLLSIGNPDFRIQLMDAGEEELGWRKCVEGKTLEEAVASAIQFTKSTSVEDYQNWFFEHVDEESTHD